MRGTLEALTAGGCSAGNMTQTGERGVKKLWTMAASIIAMWMSAPSLAPLKDVAGSAYDFEFPGIDGKPIKLSDWRGKVILVVNTASFCGYTKQYAGLQALWDTYRDRGLIVLGVPSSDFGEQEPKSEGEIKKFCQGAFGITFPLTSKQHVIGDEAHPFYKWAAEAMGSDGTPKWNFHKYLVGRDGYIAEVFPETVEPSDTRVKTAIAWALADS